ncbi:MAG TPA: patatin-like phospholipase family protein [Acidimicrobiales bacterium]|nr:patatin-like phospholipase family protein [Acidimicrobiales bacterium]
MTMSLGASVGRRQDSPAFDATDGRRVTAFVLGGGGSLGAVQVGMLQGLLEAGVRPDMIVGTSIGALNGAFLASRPDLEGVSAMGDLWMSVRRPRVFRVSVRSFLCGVLGYRDHLFDALGLRGVIGEAELGFSRLEDAPLPVHVVATDVLNGTPVVLSSGETTEALLASSAIPGVFPPVTVEDRILVDGGVVANLPVTQAIELGATRLFVLPAVAVEIGAAPGGAIDMMQRSMMMTTAALAKADLDRAAAKADVHVLPVPAPSQLSMFNFDETSELMEAAHLGTSAWVDDFERELVA